jgi:glycerophosphoryl diester phosphodiesterase
VAPFPSPQIIGHRGCAGLLPENSLSACRKAIEMQLDGFEIDVQLSADGEVIVYHNLMIDQHFSRHKGTWLTGAGPALNTLTIQDLQDYDIGHIRLWSWHRIKRMQQKATRGERIPALQQILRLVKLSASEQFKVWIEIKTNPLPPNISAEPRKLIAQTIKLIKEFNLQEQVVILSFDWRGLQYLQVIAPEIHRAYLTLENPQLDTIWRTQSQPSPWLAGHIIHEHQGSIPKLIKAAGGHIWAAHYKELTFQAIQEAQSLGLKVYAWTVNNPYYIRKLSKWGIDGLITDYPNRCKR